MDSEFDSRLQSILPLGEPGTAGSGRLRGLLERLRRYRRFRARRPVRFMSLDWWRVAGLGIFVSLFVFAVTVAVEWQNLRHAAAITAGHTVAMVEQRLGEVDKEIDRLDLELALLGQPDTCTPSVSMALARASMKSSLVQKFSIANDGQSRSCFPDGPGPTVAGPQPATGQLALYSTGEISTRLMAVRVGAGGRVITAALRPRSLDRQAQDGSPDAAMASAVSTAVLSPDGRRVIELTGSGHGNPSIEALGAVATSQRFGTKVQSSVDVPGLQASVAAALIPALGLTWMALAMGVAWLWRNKRLRGLPARQIERGLRKRQFEPYVQPIIDLATGRCSGGEILMRWAHPERGTLAPGAFIEEAERSRLIVGMSDLVMDRAAQRLAKIAAEQPWMYFSFNITSAQLRQRRFVERLGELFHGKTIPPGQVLLELTEREFVGETGAKVLQALHGAGWRIAIDDFGTGQSSLAALEQLPIDRIKIDIAFVRAIGEQTVNRPVLDAIIALGKQLSVPMIAEGVETERQWDYLSARGVQYAQGYLIGKPMPIDVFEQWLTGYQAQGKDDLPAAQEVPSLAKSTADDESRQLWHRMRSRGGLDVRDRIYWLRPYRQCFIGREAVDWMVRQLGVQRSEAVLIGRRMAALGLLEHVMQEHDFADAELYYRMASTTADTTIAPVGDDLRTAIADTDGLVMGKHSRGLIRHRQCATGSAIVDWISKRYSVPRATAVQWAAQLMRGGSLRHVYDDQPMRDDRGLYRVM